MVVLDKTIHIEASPDSVWAVLARLAAAPAWWPGLLRWESEAGVTLAPGVVLTAEREDLGMRFTSEAVTTAAEPARRFAWRQRAGDFARHEGAFTLAPDARGTRVRLRAEVELPFVLPRLVTEAEIRAHYSRAFDAALINLKDAVEAAPLAGALATRAPAAHA